MNREDRNYNWLYIFALVLFSPFYWIKAKGRENIPDGAAIICPMHSHWVDPILLALAIGKKCHLHFVGKAELFKSRFTAKILKSVGAISVKRGKNDITAVRIMMQYLKNGEKLLIFPEGTRVKANCKTEAKRGALYLAQRLNVPIVPVYLPRDKKIFHSVDIIIGKPYLVQNDSESEISASDVLMEKMISLGQEK